MQAFITRKYSFAKVFVLRNLIASKVYSSELSLSSKPRVVFIGRLDENKRVLEAMKWLDTDCQKIKEVLIFGDGPELDKLKNYEFNNFSVKFFGWLPFEEIAKNLTRHDVFVLNSRSEGEPTIVREMSFAGISSVCRDIIGVRGVTRKISRFSDKKSFLCCLDNAISMINIPTENLECLIEKNRIIQIKRFINS